MTFDFDTPIERRGTDSHKWGKYVGRDIIPLWVADTDFRVPPAVLAALRNRVDHGVFGYGDPPAELVDTVLAMCVEEWAWRVDPAWLVWLPGLVCGINVTCRATGKPGEAVASLTPVYPPFLKAPALMDRRLVTIPLGGDNMRGWTVDRRRLTAGLAEDCSLLLWCHPHNPVGRAWRREELEMVAETCLENRTVICSDEIHSQLILSEGVRHVPMAALGPDVAAVGEAEVPGVVPDDEASPHHEGFALAGGLLTGRGPGLDALDEDDRGGLLGRGNEGQVSVPGLDGRGELLHPGPDLGALRPRHQDVHRLRLRGRGDGIPRGLGRGLRGLRRGAGGDRDQGGGGEGQGTCHRFLRIGT